MVNNRLKIPLKSPFFKGGLNPAESGASLIFFAIFY